MVCLVAATASADYINTPYSMYGYGTLNDRATSMQRQMGGVGVAMNSGRQINVMNPASYASTDSLTLLFDIGADLTFLWQEENGAKERTTGGGLDYITLQFPIWKYMGASVGMLPLTQVGYSFGSDIAYGARQNQGSGGINEAFLGFSGGYAGFTAGVNVAYDFGNIINSLYSSPSTGGTMLIQHVMQVSDWNILIGAQYSKRFGRDHKLTLGLTYQPSKSILGKTYMTSQESTQEAQADTITNGILNMKHLYTQPNAVGAGINYTVEKKFRLSLEADMHWQQWSKAKFSPLYGTIKQGENLTVPSGVIFPGGDFCDRWKFAFGGEITPKLRGNYLQQMTYRLGASAVRDYIMVGDNHVYQYSLTCGFGFPVLEGKTIINLGLEWLNRQTHPAKKLGENYLNITLGVNFNEVAFWKRQIR